LSSSNLRSSKPVQLVFVILLVTCLGMVAWWIIDHSRYSEEMTSEVIALYEGEAATATALMQTYGLDPAEVAALLPAVEIQADGVPIVAPERKRALELDLASRHRRYQWEGSFFVVVLLSTLALIGVTLRQRTELLRRQQNFLAAVSHELKSPLASIKLAAETLLLRDPDTLGRRRIADRIVQSIERLDTMVTNLLDAARLDEGHIQLTPERLALGQATERAVASLTEMNSSHTVGMSLDVANDLFIRADPTAVQLVISNLVHNAMKSVKAAGGGTIHVSAAREGKSIRLEVHDTGLGFDPELGEQLFAKFFRAGSEMRRRTKGAGLGLHIARRFVTLDGGEIKANSPGENQGATFTVWWRADMEPAPGSPPQSTSIRT
jgi:signal transduction histidine kinase